MTRDDRSDLIRLASELPKGSEERRQLLAELSKEAGPSPSPILASVDQYSVWLHCKVTGYGRVYRVAADLKQAEDKMRTAAMAVQKAISDIDGVFTDVMDSYVDMAPGRELLVMQKIKLSGGVTPQQEEEVYNMVKDHVREVKGMSAIPRTIK